MTDDKLTKAEAAKRAIKAVERAYTDTDHFDYGGLASHEIMSIVRNAIKKAFGK